MPALVRLFTILCFAWCALGIAEPVAAHGDAATHAAATTTDNGSADYGPLAAADGHHHCPVADNLDRAPLANPAPRLSPPLHARGATVLASLTRAPPLQPPAA